MFSSQRVAAFGGFRQQNRMENIIANNLANAETAGFKKEVPAFSQILAQAGDRFKVQEDVDLRISFLPGDIRKTGNGLDLAIEGQGFFKIKTPQGVRYTRGGNFTLNKNKVLVNSEGFPVLGEGGEITIDGKNVTVKTDGSIAVGPNEVGKIALVTFPDLGVLQKEGHNLLKPADEPEELRVQDPQIFQGALETSNVNPIEEMLDLLDAHRSYEACLKVIQSDDSLDSKAVNDLGRV